MDQDKKPRGHDLRKSYVHENDPPKSERPSKIEKSTHENKPMEWWITHKKWLKTWRGWISSVPIESGLKVIEHSAYEAEKKRADVAEMNYETMRQFSESLEQKLSMLPKVPTQPYEKELAQKIDILEKKLAKAVEQRDWLAKNTPITCSHFNGDISKLNKELDAISFSDEKDVGKDEK